MSVIKEKTEEATKKPMAPLKRETPAPTTRTVVIALSVGVLIGLLLRR